MRALIVSDLHVDLNRTYDFGFIDRMGDVDITFICGDIAGSIKCEQDFLNYLPKNSNVVAISGNHLGYDFYTDGHTKTECLALLKDTFNESVKYMENEYVEIKDKVIYAGTMYSDFNLYGKKQNRLCKQVAERWMNDFRLVHVLDKSNTRMITADDYAKAFKKFKYGLKSVISKTNKDIIVVTHFAPSKKSIVPKYNNQRKSTWYLPGYELNAAYASNLEKFILENPQIKLWCHGHMHDYFEYDIGQCHVICNPYGYYGHDHSIEPNKYKGKIIEL